MPTDAKAPTRVIGFDPGFDRLGAAVVQKEGGREKLVFSTCFTTQKGAPFDERFRHLGACVDSLLKTVRPHAVALERVYLGNNKKTAMGVSEVRGMLRHLAGVYNLPVFEYGPGEVKLAVTGYGASDKKAVAHMVRRLVSFPEGKRLDDEIDAVAVALTCLASARRASR